MAAELRLGVSFDLVYFRQQLQKLGQIAASEFSGKVKLGIDKQNFQRQFNQLTKDLRINVNDSQLIGARTNLGKLNQSIATLRRATATPIEIKVRYKEEGKPPAGFGGTAARAVTGRIGGTQAVEGLGRAELQKLYGLFREANLNVGKLSSGLGRATAEELRDALIPAFSDSGEDAVNGLANGIKNGSSKVGKAAARLGLDTLQAVKDVLGIASPSREFRYLGEYAAEGFEIGLTEGLKEAQTSAVARMRAILMALKEEASKFGPALMMAGGGMAGQKGLKEAIMMAAGMGGLFTPETMGQRMFRQARGGIASQYGAGASQSFTGGPSPFRYSMGGSPIAGLLGPAGSTGGSIGREAQFAQRQLEALARSAERAERVLREDRMPAVVAGQMPRGPSGPFLPPAGGSGGNVGGGGGGRGGFSGFNFGGAVPNLPGKGLVRELGDEFAFAAKQVVLFGATYKALAFLTSFPAQVGQAVGALQTYRNTLDAISPSAQEAERSNALILELVDKYNVPLQSAREGFTRLYASMQPAGFAGKEIENIFIGITQASATFGLSADKVDRVNYAFAQMASKGQVMSEELKGQLGDVLPGAMAIFAEAAGFEGPAAIQEFSAALEDGQFKGEAMVALLKNVGVVMQQEFGPGAEGAARTFQGVINRMQNSLTLLYESFEPVAVGFLNTFVVPITNGIQTVSDGVTAFLSGATANTAAGASFAKELEALRPAFEGIRQNIQNVLPLLAQFAQIGLEVGKVFLQIAGNPIVGYLARLYIVALPVVTVFGRLFAAFTTIRTALTSANVALLTGAQRFTTYRVIMEATGISASKLSTTLRVMSPLINGVSIALKTLAAPAILLGISLIIERFMMLKGAIDDVRRSTQTMLGSISSMANSGAVGELKNVAGDTAKQIRTFEQLKPYVGGGALGPAKQLTPEVAKKFQELGLGGFLDTNLIGGKPFVKDFVNASKIIEERLISLRKISGNVQQKLPLAQKIAADIAARTKPQEVTPLPEASGGEGEKDKDKKERESQVPQLQLRLELAKKLFEFDKAIASAQLAGNTVLESRLQLSRDLTELEYERRQILLEDIPDNEKQLKISELRFKQEEAILKSQLNLRLQLQQEFEKTQQAFTDILLGYKEEADFQKRYYDLVQRGINPALAKTTVEVEKRFAQELKSLENQLEQQELGVATLETEIERAKVAGVLSEVQKKELEDAKARLEILKEEIKARKLLKGETPEAIQKAVGEAQKIEEPKPFGVTIAEEYEKIKKQLAELTSAANLVVFSANSIGDAFGQAFKDIVTGAENWRDALGNAFRSIASQFADLVAQILAKSVALQIIGLFLPGAGSFSGGAGFGSQTALPTGTGIGAGNGIIQNAGGQGFGTLGPNFGFRQFATGGVVTGPTLGLVGEGRFNEAVVPLPNGKSIPVDLGDGAGSNISTNIVVNVNNGQASSQVTGAGGQAFGRELEGAVRSVILKESRPGGIIYNQR